MSFIPKRTALHLYGSHLSCGWNSRSSHSTLEPVPWSVSNHRSTRYFDSSTNLESLTILITECLRFHSLRSSSLLNLRGKEKSCQLTNPPQNLKKKELTQWHLQTMLIRPSKQFSILISLQNMPSLQCVGKHHIIHMPDMRSCINGQSMHLKEGGVIGVHTSIDVEYRCRNIERLLDIRSLCNNLLFFSSSGCKSSIISQWSSILQCPAWTR